MRCLLLSAITLCAIAQSDAPPAFDAASVKPNASGDGHASAHTRTANVQITNRSLRFAIAMAYKIKEYQVQGPAWLASEKFDIVAKAPVGTPDEQLPLMMRTLLAERFNLKTHLETKEFPVYGLVPVKGRFKLKPVEAGDSGRDTEHNKMGGQLTATKTSMDRLAQWLSNEVDRPVVDMTGIQGVYDFTLKFSPEKNETADADQAPRYPIVPLAIQEQLGLRLERRTAPIEVLVIDRADRVPVEN
jgi:uncharacterized protein (TIGR03435 family)